MSRDLEGLEPSTIAVTAGRPEAGPQVPTNQPPVLSSTFHRGPDYTYARHGNPTWAAFEEALGALEGGVAIAFASGMAATSAIISTLPPGATVAAAHDAYYGTRAYLRSLDETGKLQVRFTDVADTSATLDAVDGADLLWLESPTNPMLAIADLAALAAGGRAAGALVVVDNTFATPVLQRPLELGADVVVHSVSKYISGHSDIVMGAAVTRDSALAERLHSQRSLTGGIPGPMETFLALRGLRTLPLRVERAQHNAQVLAARLAEHPRVERVLYPGLESHPGHEIASKQMSGPGGMLSFLPTGDADAAEAICERVRLIAHVTSLGGVETSIERRARYAGEEGTPPNLLRLTVGIENADDLWRDLNAALSAS